MTIPSYLLMLTAVDGALVCATRVIDLQARFHSFGFLNKKKKNFLDPNLISLQIRFHEVINLEERRCFFVLDWLSFQHCKERGGGGGGYSLSTSRRSRRQLSSTCLLSASWEAPRSGNRWAGCFKLPRKQTESPVDGVLSPASFSFLSSVVFFIVLVRPRFISKCYPLFLLFALLLFNGFIPFFASKGVSPQGSPASR